MSEINFGKIKWQSRRGMRELDLMLLPFVEHDLPNLGDEVLSDYVDLLKASDLELFRWLHGTAKPDSQRRQKMVDLIVSLHEKRRGREGV